MIGERLFRIGLFLLPSSALLGGLCLLAAAVIGSRGRAVPIWRDRWCQPLLLAAALMLIGALQATTGSLAWVGLGNWLPLIWAFWAFQPYLISERQRRNAAWMLVAGTLPVLLTGFGQMFLGWEGPWQLGGEAVVWFVAPGGKPLGRLSGLFDYANVAGAWLGVIWPLMIAAVLRPDGWRRRGAALVLALAAGMAVLLTQSRNAMGGLALALPLVIGPARWIWLLPLMLLVPEFQSLPVRSLPAPVRVFGPPVFLCLSNRVRRPAICLSSGNLPYWGEHASFLDAVRWRVYLQRASQQRRVH